MRRLLRFLYNGFVRLFWPENVEHTQTGTAPLKVMEKPNAQLFESIQSTILAEGKTFSIRVKGYSMRPFLEDRRDMVKIKAVDNVEVGDVVLALVAPSRYVLHRIIAKDGDNLTLMGDGNLYGKEYCQVQNVMGKAIEFWYGKVCEDLQNDGSVKYKLEYSDKRVLKCDDDEKYKSRYRMWGRLVRYRRWFLAVYRRWPSVKITVRYMDAIDLQNKQL